MACPSCHRRITSHTSIMLVFRYAIALLQFLVINAHGNWEKRWLFCRDLQVRGVGGILMALSRGNHSGPGGGILMALDKIPLILNLGAFFNQVKLSLRVWA